MKPLYKIVGWKVGNMVTNILEALAYFIWKIFLRKYISRKYMSEKKKGGEEKFGHRFSVTEEYNNIL